MSVLPLQGPAKGPCACGCAWRTLKRRPGGHVRGCDCPRCRGKRNRAKGDLQARQARKLLGLPGVNSRHEELWAGDWRIEVKAGAQVKAAWTTYLRAEKQSEQARPIGDHRPFLAVAMPDNDHDGLVLLRLSTFARHFAYDVSMIGSQRPPEAPVSDPECQVCLPDPCTCPASRGPN